MKKKGATFVVLLALVEMEKSVVHHYSSRSDGTERDEETLRILNRHKRRALGSYWDGAIREGMHTKLRPPTVGIGDRESKMLPPHRSHDSPDRLGSAIGVAHRRKSSGRSSWGLFQGTRRGLRCCEMSIRVRQRSKSRQQSSQCATHGRSCTCSRSGYTRPRDLGIWVLSSWVGQVKLRAPYAIGLSFVWKRMVCLGREHLRRLISESQTDPRPNSPIPLDNIASHHQAK